MKNRKYQLCLAIHTLTLSKMLIGVHSNDMYFDVPGYQRLFRNVPTCHIFAGITQISNLHSPEEVCGVNGKQLTQEEEEIAMEVVGTEPDIGESLCLCSQASDIYV